MARDHSLTVTPLPTGNREELFWFLEVSSVLTSKFSCLRRPVAQQTEVPIILKSFKA